jgi:hypothetical protein
LNSKNRRERDFAHVCSGVVKITAEDIEESLTCTMEYGIYLVNGRERMRGVRRPPPFGTCTKVLMFFYDSIHAHTTNYHLPNRQWEMS